MRSDLSAILHQTTVDSQGNAEDSVGQNQKKSPKKPLKVFHINLSWECAALPPFGSGKYTSSHQCEAGKVKVTKSKATNGKPSQITSWTWERAEGTKTPIVPDLWKYGAEPVSSLLTSCSHRFLQSLTRWNKPKPNNPDEFDVLTLSELANPGIQGMVYLGHTPETVPKAYMTKQEQQLDPAFYEILSSKILQNYGVFGNVVVKQFIVLQATYYHNKRMGEPTLAVGTNMLAKDKPGERPISALFFAHKKTLVLNVHGIHFRKELVSHVENFGPDMLALLQSMGKTVQLNANGMTEYNEFGMEDFPTASLREIYGSWLSHKILEAVISCPDTDGHNENEAVFCKGTNAIAIKGVLRELQTIAKHYVSAVKSQALCLPGASFLDSMFRRDKNMIASSSLSWSLIDLNRLQALPSKCEDWATLVAQQNLEKQKIGQLLRDWKIIVAGDLNDETNELGEFIVLGQKVTSGRRKRTCCSMMDGDYAKLTDGAKYDESLDTEILGHMPRRPLNWFANICKYFKTQIGLMDYLNSPLNPMNPDNGVGGAPKVNPRGDTVPSGYPFPSDNILAGSSNLECGDVEFPVGYKQVMQNGKTPSNLISDHDPLTRSCREK